MDQIDDLITPPFLALALEWSIHCLQINLPSNDTHTACSAYKYVCGVMAILKRKTDVMSISVVQVAIN